MDVIINRLPGDHLFPVTTTTPPSPVVDWWTYSHVNQLSQIDRLPVRLCVQTVCLANNSRKPAPEGLKHGKAWNLELSVHSNSCTAFPLWLQNSITITITIIPHEKKNPKKNKPVSCKFLFSQIFLNFYNTAFILPFGKGCTTQMSTRQACITASMSRHYTEDDRMVVEVSLLKTNFSWVRDVPTLLSRLI